MIVKISPVFVFLLLLPFTSIGQQDNPYPFINNRLNNISNGERGMRNFYMRLSQLEQKKIRTLNIVHIGDSHIQADWFSGKVRTLLQQKFGSAGRGLVFPYALARTNSPEDIYASSNVRWSARRTIDRSGSLPIGLSGITLQTRESNFYLNLKIKEGPSPLHYKFNKVTLFTESNRGFKSWIVNNQNSNIQYRQPAPPRTMPQKSRSSPTFHVVQSGENLTLISNKYGISIQELKELNGLKNDVIYPGKRLKISESGGQGAPRSQESFKAPGSFMQQFYLPYPTREIRLQAAASGQTARLYGVVLENYHQTGILYHMIGVNGAKFEHYNRSEAFHKHVQALRPDLIIVSLGTNEAANGYFNKERFYEEVDEFIHELEMYNRFADILITTPPDSYKSRSYPNPVVGKIKQILTDYATSNDLACWDFYKLMGGSGSMEPWHRYNLAQSDKLHLTKPGYELQGKLLYEALIGGYELYRNRR